MIGLSCVPFLYLAANVSTDPLNIIIVLLYIITSQEYVAGRRIIWLVWMTIIACFIPLLRLVGVSLIAINIILIWVKLWSDKKKALLTSSFQVL